jgi:hypothetical protein
MAKLVRPFLLYFLGDGSLLDAALMAEAYDQGQNSVLW